MTTSKKINVKKAEIKRDAPQVEKGDTVKVHYALTLSPKGKVIDTNVGRDPMELEVGSKDFLLAFSEGIIGMKEKEIRSFSVKAKKGYGEYHPELKQIVKTEPLKKATGKDPEVGMVIQMQNKHDLSVANATVTAVDGDKMVLDLNHPLAGKDLFFKVKVAEVKKAKSKPKSSSKKEGKKAS